MNKIVQWWLGINWKTRLISIIVLVISIIISAISFVSLMQLQTKLMDTNFRFFRDFSALVAYDVINLMQNMSGAQLQVFIERIYLSTAIIDYLQLFDSNGFLFISLPASSPFYKSIVDLHIDPVSLKYSISFLNLPISDCSISLKSNIVNCIIPLIIENKVLGFLQLGLNFNNNICYVNKIAQNATSFIFVIIWLLFILGTAFNFFSIIDPINELLIGMQNIAWGNFGFHLNVLANGSLGDLIIIFNEMSERLQFYENNNIAQLTSDKVKLESIASTIKDGAILLDSELRILLVNQIAVKVLYWSNKDLIGHVISQYLPNHVNYALLPILNSIIRSNCFEDQTIRSKELIINLNHSPLKTYRFLLSTVSIYNQKYFNGVAIIIQDITREHQLNKAKNQFISNVSHELRTPLCNIGSFLETLIDYKHKLTSQQQGQFLHIAYAETQRLNNLVNDILDLSRLESEYSYILKPITLTNTVSYIIQASQIISLNKQVQILIEVHPDINIVFAHQNSLCQVLSNLISNSLKFTHKKGKIIIRVYPLILKEYKINSYYSMSKVVRLEIIDEGIGIDRIFQKQIFDRFMRIENNVHSIKGTGLGLSIVQNIIKKHNSMISIYSELGIGTSLWFDLFIVT